MEEFTSIRWVVMLNIITMVLGEIGHICDSASARHLGPWCFCGRGVVIWTIYTGIVH